MSRAAEPAETRDQRLERMRLDIATALAPITALNFDAVKDARERCVDHAAVLLSELEAATRQRDALWESLEECEVQLRIAAQWAPTPTTTGVIVLMCDQARAAIALCPPLQAGRGGTDGGDEDDAGRRPDGALA